MNSSTLNKAKTANPEKADKTDTVFEPQSDYAAQPSAKVKPPGKYPSWLMANVILPIGILAVGAVAVLLLGKKAVPTKPPEDQSLAARVERLPEVATLPVRSLDVAGGHLDLQVDGEVVPYRELQIATEVAGQVIYKDASCEVGSYVTEGQLLFRIDPTDYENEVERLSKAKEQEYQAIRELEQEEVNNKRLVDVATKDVELRDREIERLKSLPSGFASQSELDQAQRSRLQALNQKVTLENQLDLLRQRRARLEAAEQLAATQLNMAKKNLERTEIRSPVSGVIYREDAELNSFVQRGQVIVTIEDTSKAEVVVNLRTDQLYWVLDQNRSQQSLDGATPEDPNALPTKPGNAAPGKDYALPQTPATIEYSLAGRDDEVLRWEGTLVRYDGIGFDPGSRTVPVRIVVDQPRRFNAKASADDSSAEVAAHGDSHGNGMAVKTIAAGPTALVRGMFVSVILHVEPRKPLVVVPAVALKPGSTGNRLWKFEPDMSVLEQEEQETAEPDTTDAQKADSPQLASTAISVNTDEAEGTANDEDGADAGSKAEKDEKPPFDPNAWVVGRVEVLERVRPIESVSLEEAANEDGKIARGSNGKTTYWICEIGDGVLESGDRLIVSPLPSFEGKGRDGVRAPVQQETVATQPKS